MHKKNTVSSTSAREVASLVVKYATGAAALACAGHAQAGLIVTSLNLNVTGDSQFLKFNNFASNATSVDLTFGNSSSKDLEIRWATNSYGGVTAQSDGGKSVKIMGLPNPGGAFNQRVLIAYAPGSTISGTSLQDYGKFRNNNIYASGWELNTTKYVGFQLTFNSSTYTGWMELTLTSPQNFTIGDVAINTTPGESIVAGASAVPEPAESALAFAAGAAGLLALRAKRRRTAALAAV